MTNLKKKKKSEIVDWRDRMLTAKLIIYTYMINLNT